MPAKSTAKILAKLINMYRAAYVKTAQITMGQDNLRSAIMNAIFTSKSLAPGPRMPLLKDILKGIPSQSGSKIISASKSRPLQGQNFLDAIAENVKKYG